MIKILIGAAVGYAAGAAYTTYTATHKLDVPYFTTELKNYMRPANYIGAGIGAFIGWRM